MRFFCKIFNVDFSCVDQSLICVCRRLLFNGRSVRSGGTTTMGTIGSRPGGAAKLIWQLTKAPKKGGTVPPQLERAWQDATLFSSFGLPNGPRVSPFLETPPLDVSRARLSDFSQRASSTDRQQRTRTSGTSGTMNAVSLADLIHAKLARSFGLFFFGWLRKQIGDNRANNGSAHC